MTTERKGGRPRIGATVTFSIRDGQKATIESLAILWDVPQSDVVRRALDLGLPMLTTNPFTPNPHAVDREQVA